MEFVVGVFSKYIFDLFHIIYIYKFSNLFDIKIEEESKQLPSMYWIPKMNKKPVGARFIIAKLFTSMWKVFIKKAVSFLEQTNFGLFKTPSLF